MKVLVTGGAGFIGTHLARHLLTAGHDVTVVDNFSPQIHQEKSDLAEDLRGAVRLIRGDVRDYHVWEDVLPGHQALVHLAAETGTGQSMYEVSRYEQVNLSGTANLYQLLAARAAHGLERIVVASSRAIYGEGAYSCAVDGLVYPRSRSVAEKLAGHFEPLCPKCSGSCSMLPTSEDAPFQPSSFYGLTKQVQEQMALLFGNALGITSVALRYQNVYGPGQSLQNPYTGILAIFSNLARTGSRIRVFEDGQESRDFVYIDDVVRATAAALTGPLKGCHSLNVGSESRTSVMDVATQINAFFGGQSTIEITGDFREGDVRHGMADLKAANALLGYEPKWRFEDGIRKFLEWASESEPNTGLYEQSLVEMKDRGLLYDRN